MGMYFPLLWLMIMKAWVVTSTPTTLNETCFDGATATFMLSFGLYQDSCPEAEAIVFAWVERAVSEDPRMAASLLRLHFHDCFVNASHHHLHVDLYYMYSRFIHLILCAGM